MSKLALFGGEKAVAKEKEEPFKWPIITHEDEEAVLDVLRRGAMSGTDVTMKFEQEFADWLGVKYALGFNNGTASIHAAMYAAGVGTGDEVICPTITYWASCLQAYSLGATVAFANIDPVSLCIDPADIEKKISSRTKAIIAVHYLSHPCDMDAIMAMAKKHGIKVIEDVSHAQGGLYKGKRLGTFGDVSAMSLMTGKAFAIGEAGMIVTNNLELYERAISFGHYERFNGSIQSDSLKPYIGLPLGGYKYRMHQLSSAVGRVQLKHYDERCAQIRHAMDYFWELIADLPGIIPHRINDREGSNMAGYYLPFVFYDKDAYGGLSTTRFCEAVRAEGFGSCAPGCNKALHTHSVFQVADVYAEGKPTRIAKAVRDVRVLDKNLETSIKITNRLISIPWFKQYEPSIIKQYADAFRKVSENYEELLKDDQGDPGNIGGWHFFRHTKKKDENG